MDFVLSIDHIENLGTASEYYRVWFRDGSYQDLTEEQFYEEDKYYGGELGIRVVN